MAAERRRVEDDLRGMIRGEVDCDPVTTALYSSDASIYQIEPIGVIRPKTESDIASVVTYAEEHDLSIHARGAGSGIAGDSIGPGLVIDLSRFMRRIDISNFGQRFSAEGGATLASVNSNLRRNNRWFGPDPITRSITTIGSVMARDAEGSHFLRSGSARDSVRELTVILADGTKLKAGQHSIDEPSPAGEYCRALYDIRKRYANWIDDPSRPTMGYRIADAIQSDQVVDLAKFFVGTQGTLGIITGVVADTEPIPTHRGVLLCFYQRLDMAVREAIKSCAHGVVACDWMDRRLLQIARDTDPEFRDLLPAAAEAMVLVEIQSESLGDLTDRLATIRREMTRGPDAAFDTVDTTVPARRDRFWRLMRRVIPRLYRLSADQFPQPFIEDVRIPRESINAAISDIQLLLRGYETTATMFGQLGRGSLHIRPFLNLADSDDQKRLEAISRDIAEIAWKYGGEINARHAAGLSKTYLLPKQYGELWQVMGQVKRLFDPNHRFNPGKLFGASIQSVGENLRPADRQIEVVQGDRVIEEADPQIARLIREGKATSATLPVMQDWPPGREISAAVRQCNGCGRCRTTAKNSRQCPVFRAIPAEEASPRSKANLLRSVINGQLPIEALSSEKAKAVADLCFNCHQCRLECPASVDIPKIVGELKAQYVAGNGQSLSDYFMARIDTVAGIASRFPSLSNRLMRMPAARWIAEKLFDLSAARPLPSIAKETFIRHAVKQQWHRPQPEGGLKVCYFVDHFANQHDPEIGRSVAEVLRHNSVHLYVPPNQSPSGMARITMGDIPAARKLAKRNVRLLAEAVRQGYTIIATEPAAVLCLRHEYPNLLDNEDAILVAAHTKEICEYLWELHQGDRLALDFQPIAKEFAYHQPCHLRVLDPEGTTVSLMNLIPLLRATDVKAGCSGMAGTWGLRRTNYRNSLRIGWPLVSAMRAAAGNLASTQCAACRMQIEHSGGRKTIHPIKLVAHAYGRLPELASAWSEGELPEE